jgi:hypothetical protein
MLVSYSNTRCLSAACGPSVVVAGSRIRETRVGS